MRVVRTQEELEKRSREARKIKEALTVKPAYGMVGVAAQNSHGPSSPVHGKDIAPVFAVAAAAALDGTVAFRGCKFFAVYVYPNSWYHWQPFVALSFLKALATSDWAGRVCKLGISQIFCRNVALAVFRMNSMNGWLLHCGVGVGDGGPPLQNYGCNIRNNYYYWAQQKQLLRVQAAQAGQEEGQTPRPWDGRTEVEGSALMRWLEEEPADATPNRMRDESTPDPTLTQFGAVSISCANISHIISTRRVRRVPGDLCRHRGVTRTRGRNISNSHFRIGNDHEDPAISKRRCQRQEDPSKLPVDHYPTRR
ncbi:hypothetical protein THAOC_11502, partial [Thalassiosira oceanica]